jgi:LysM repeat protein
MRLSEFLNEAPAQPVAAPAIPTATQQARLKDMEAGQAKGKTAIDKFNQGDNVGGVMTAASGINDLANAAGMSFLQKLETGWMAIKAGARAAWAGRKGNGDAAIVAAIGSLGGEVSELFDDIVNEPDFYQKFQQGMLAMKDSTDPDQQEMYKKYMARQLTAESFKAYINQFNAAMQNMKKNPATAQLPTELTPYVTPVENPTDPNANPMSQDPAQQAQRAATNETAELNRILKLSGMEFIAEDATGTQQFVGTGSSKIMSQAQNNALSNATDKLLRQKFGNNFQNQDSPLIYYNQEIKFAADTSKPGNYLATVILTPKEYKLSPGISAKPSMDPNQVLDYFYKGEQIKTTDPFYSKVKQMHIDSLESPAEPATTTNETAELSRLSKLISEDSSKSITVQRGDTLGKIAADNSTTVDALVKLNNIANRDRIYPGDVIKIPGGQGDPGGKTKRRGSTRIPDRAEKLTTTTSTGNPKIAMEFFLDQGWTPEQAAGLVANLQAESYDHIDPAAENSGAYGIAQWRGSRKRDFEQEMGMPLKGSSLMDQLKFVQHELNNKEAKAGRLLKRTTTAAEAAEIVDEFYERSGGAAIRRRIALANSLLTAFA